MARRARSFVLAFVIGGLLVGSFALPASAANPEHSVVVNDNPADFTPHVVDGRVYAIIQVGNKMIAGGSFTQVQQTANGANIARNRIFAFDATTGVIDPNFKPNIDGDVYSLVATPDGHIIAGGTFSNVNGVASQKLTKLNLSDGQRVTHSRRGRTAGSRTWSCATASSTSPAASAGSTTSCATASLRSTRTRERWTRTSSCRSRSPATGFRFPASTPWRLIPAGTKLMIIGNFTNVGGQHATRRR